MNYIQSSSMVSMMNIPSLNNISKDIINKSDTNSDSSLSIEELGISQDLFSSLDSDGDSLVTSNEIASAIDAQLSQFNGEFPSKEEFASLLSNLGLEMPEPPTVQTNAMASDLMNQYDTDADGLLSSEEVSLLTQDEFNALDANLDGSISTEELSSAIEQVASAKPSGGGGGGGSSSSDEEYDEADTNQDGFVSYEEKMAALGIDIASEETSNQTTSNEDILDTIKTLFDAIKTNSTQKDEDISLGNFKNLMTMVNNQNNSSELNTYVSNLASATSKFNYA
ncbi:MAG: EF-hand domain-containing protein [Arcobacteraceae bacterium]